MLRNRDFGGFEAEYVENKRIVLVRIAYRIMYVGTTLSSKWHYFDLMKSDNVCRGPRSVNLEEDEFGFKFSGERLGSNFHFEVFIIVTVE